MKLERFAGMVVIGALTFGAGACGGGDDEAGEGGSLRDALAVTMLEEQGGSPVATPEQADCWAGGVVDGIGEDRLAELGMTPEAVSDVDEYDFTEREIDTVVDSLFGCTDVQQAFADQFAADFGDEAAQCIADELDADLVKEALKASIAGAGSEPSPEFVERFTQIATDCGLEG